MDELTEKLSSLFADPDGMEKIKAMAQSMLGAQNALPQTETPSEPDFDLAAVARMMSLLKNRGDDDRVRLLLALRPHLSEEKQRRVDSAVKMLKLLDMAPLLREAGLFSL